MPSSESVVVGPNTPLTKLTLQTNSNTVNRFNMFVRVFSARAHPQYGGEVVAGGVNALAVVPIEAVGAPPADLLTGRLVVERA